MTNRTEIEELAAQVGATIREDAAGRVSRITWNGTVYGAGSMSSLLAFAEKARPVVAARMATA